MQHKVQARLTIALLFTALAVLAFFATTVISGPIDFLYRNAAGLSTARSAAQIIVLLAVIALFASGLIIAIPTALQPGSWLRKLLYVLPIYMLGFTLVGIVSTQVLGVGTVGTFFNLNGVGPIMLATAWLALGAVLSVITVVIAAARAKLSGSIARAAVMTAAAASGLSILAAIAMLVSVAILSTSTPATFGGGGGFPGGGGNAQGQRPGRGGATAPQSTAEVSGGAGASQSTAEAPAGGFPSRQNQGGAPGQGLSTAEAPSGGFAPRNSGAGAPQSTAEASSGGFASGQTAPGGSGASQGQAQSTAEVGGRNGAANGGGQFPQGNAPQGGGQGGPGGGGGFPGGGPGGGSGSFVRNYEIGGALMAVFAVISIAGTITALRASTPATAGQTQPIAGGNLPREAGMAILSGVGLTVILIVLMQIPPVSRTNPPVQTAIKWDSAQTQDLATRACMNCHSNETNWPWYAYIAPSSWLTTLHVNNARMEFNLSELNTLPAFRKSMLGDQIAMQIRSGTMPPKDFLLLHPEAHLTDTEKEQLITGFQTSLAGS